MRRRSQTFPAGNLNQWLRSPTLDSTATTLHDAAPPGSAAKMIHPPASLRVCLCLRPCDMHRSFDGLHALVSESIC